MYVQFLSLYNNEIFKRYFDRLVGNRIRWYSLRWAGYLICMSNDDSARKVYMAISMVKKEDVVVPASDSAVASARTLNSY